ncbi:hypothetical protein GCM10011309_14050 [Litorimonas cladophorae]|uniref:Polyketide cyclase / dehydrase and lipid transport n=1 Tax=Litorimonas cladophorae TaxID=1220491 RepID=A0A918KL25_9PROT|nr:hypothetical protein [Litorimonas cladophorae]GGX64971.1 hypothetical protein GCM10011309_14050 [Litorimonas cladophorae]
MTLKHLLTGGPKPIWIRYLLILGVVTLITRLVLDSRFATTSFFYCLVPYVIGVILYLFVPQPQGWTKTRRIGRHLLATIIVMLASSALLFEGFICVIMAAPIYIFFALLAILFMPDVKDPDRLKQSDVFRASFVPLIIIVLSVEGLTEQTSFPREESITRTHVLDLTPEEIHANLAQPVHLDAKRSKFLSLFPLPERIDAPNFAQGQTHKAYFTYRRWGFTNVHRGETHLHMKTVQPLLVETEVTKDTSYFSHYLTVHGTKIKMTPLADGTTEVSLTIRYRRELDPAWYFGPLQRRAIRESGDYLLEHIIGKVPEPNKLGENDA